MIKEILNNQGLSIGATYTQNELEEIFLPLLLEKIYKQKQRPYTFQALPMDGFHHTNDYLSTHYTTRNGLKMPLKGIKGKPETFDLEDLKQAIQALKTEKEIEWPIYSRSLHDVADETFTVDADILLFEGNYLLLERTGWGDLAAYADYTIMLSAPLDLLKERLLNRKSQGGHLKNEAFAHYNRVDLPNYHLVMNQSVKADLEFVLNDQQEWVIK